MPHKSPEHFAKIIEREFCKTIPTAGVLVDMSEDEVIRVTYNGDVYECDCSDDEEFVFICGDLVVRFLIPADYLE